MTTVEVNIDVDKLGAAALLEIFCTTVVDEEALGATVVEATEATTELDLLDATVTLLLILGVDMDVLGAAVNVATMVIILPVCAVATTELDSLDATLVEATLPLILGIDMDTEVDSSDATRLVAATLLGFIEDKETVLFDTTLAAATLLRGGVLVTF